MRIDNEEQYLLENEKIKEILNTISDAEKLKQERKRIAEKNKIPLIKISYVEAILIPVSMEDFNVMKPYLKYNGEYYVLNGNNTLEKSSNEVSFLNKFEHKLELFDEF